MGDADQSIKKADKELSERSAHNLTGFYLCFGCMGGGAERAAMVPSLGYGLMQLGVYLWANESTDLDPYSSNMGLFKYIE
jgi:hypothetical protein